MSVEAQRVVVIYDASRDVSSSAIRRALQGLSLKPGDALKFLGVLHQVNNPSMLSFTGAGKFLGYRIKLDSSSMFGTNQKIIAEEISRKNREYQKNEEIMNISRQCEAEKFKEVRAGSSSKLVALKAIKSFKATWVILDRHMKKDKKYFMKMLSCGISRMKSNDSIEQLRGPKVRDCTKLLDESFSKDQVTYDEMIPGSPSGELTPRQSQASYKTNLGEDQRGGGEPPRQNNRKSASLSKSSSSDPWQNNRKYASLSKSSSSEQFMTTSTPLNYEASTSSFSEVKYSPRKMERQTLVDRSSFFIDESPDKGSPDENHPKNDQVFRNSSCSICKNRRPNIGWKRDFSYAELQKATEAFSPKNFLSEGGFGCVYRGEINGLKIAVKQHKNASFQGEKEFKSEVQVLSKARHDNVVMLLGSCSEGNHRLLVYEFVCNGSLDQHLSKHTRRPLSWEKRIKIAMGAAKGLQYLHENNIIHRDMRPNNILVTHDYESMLGDFGLARTQCEGSDHSSETRVVGTLGYLAPEYAECGKVSTKTDVYSFGVVLLQLITGLKTTDKVLGGKSLVGWARPLLKERNYPDLIDPRILDSHDVHQLFWMVRVAEKCLSKDPQKRLPMDIVVDALKYIMEGSATCNIRGFSPAQSDSISSSLADSSESQCDNESSSVQMQSIRPFQRLPPSPTVPSSSSGRSTAHNMGGEEVVNKKRDISQVKSKLLYDEMVLYM
ncbi:hypothetical protein JRO89_XS14G0001000 [Xanthoceras sorbifolium]|uniref:Protein kinase domain-containing protein n=1 Tax=Xanthoceras sorbifolium TaxID=99658 RepID=A0ABQ8H2Z5_9ROSI|nr:hypothetical protein JRO89_XS14G0001000 [Xanthoceras sorbifolium]